REHLGEVLHGIGLVPRGATLGVRDLVGRDPVHEGHEGTSLAPESRQSREDRDQHFLRDPVSRQVDTLRATDTGAAIPHHTGPYELQHPRGGGAVTLDRIGYGEFQLVCCTCHRISGAPCYTDVLRGTAFLSSRDTRRD